jgi:cytochrome c biogenesis protein CcdA
MTNPEQKTQTNKQLTFKKTLAFSLEFGFMIVLPLLVFVYIGKWLENHYHNHIFLVAGLLLALTTSSVWFYKRIIDIYNDFLK